MPSLLAFIKDPERRAILSFIGGGAVVVCGGLWTAVTFYVEHREGQEKSGETSAVIWLMRSQNERISELERKLEVQKAQLDDFKTRVPPSDLAVTNPSAYERIQELRRQLAPADPQIEAILSDPLEGLNKLDEDIAAQARRVEALQNSRLPSATVDVETMKLKRLIDKRSQLFDLLRQITDRYNQTAKGIIDSLGR
jgi:hypothetical protein